MKEFGKGPKFEHPKILLRNQLIIYLLHKYVYHMFLGLWSEISLFHKLIYDIAQGSILIGLDVAVCL